MCNSQRNCLFTVKTTVHNLLYQFCGHLSQKHCYLQKSTLRFSVFSRSLLELLPCFGSLSCCRVFYRRSPSRALAWQLNLPLSDCGHTIPQQEQEPAVGCPDLFVEYVFLSLPQRRRRADASTSSTWCQLTSRWPRSPLLVCWVSNRSRVISIWTKWKDAPPLKEKKKC